VVKLSCGGEWLREQVRGRGLIGVNPEIVKGVITVWYVTYVTGIS